MYICVYIYIYVYGCVFYAPHSKSGGKLLWVIILKLFHASHSFSFGTIKITGTPLGNNGPARRAPPCNPGCIAPSPPPGSPLVRWHCNGNTMEASGPGRPSNSQASHSSGAPAPLRVLVEQPRAVDVSRIPVHGEHPGQQCHHRPEPRHDGRQRALLQPVVQQWGQEHRAVQAA